MDRLGHLLSQQAGVVARRQAIEAGLDDSDFRRLLRRRELVTFHPGVYVDHTGPLSWEQRAWAAVLFAGARHSGSGGGGAALCDQSALHAWGLGTPGDGPVHVAIDRRRRVRPPAGIVVHRLLDLDARTLWNLSPPRLRLEEAVLDVAAAARDELAAVGVLSAAVSDRRTTARRLATTLAARSRIARRSFLGSVLDDLDRGTCSVLEHGYLHRVERAHGLPRGRRQAVGRSRGRIYRDVLYEEFAQVVELDGWLDHTGAEARDRDLERDLDAAVEGLATVRLGWGQVFRRPCLTARRLAALLRRAGWSGELRTCADCSA